MTKNFEVEIKIDSTLNSQMFHISNWDIWKDTFGFKYLQIDNCFWKGLEMYVSIVKIAILQGTPGLKMLLPVYKFSFLNRF